MYKRMYLNVCLVLVLVVGVSQVLVVFGVSEMVGDVVVFQVFLVSIGYVCFVNFNVVILVVGIYFVVFFVCCVVCVVLLVLKLGMLL